MPSPDQPRHATDRSSTRSIVCPPDEMPRAAPEQIQACLRAIYGAYRRDEAADAQQFVLQVAALLERYPLAVLVTLADPGTGIQTRLKFPPTPSEIREACDAEMMHLDVLWRASAEYRRRERQSAGLLEGPRARRPSVEELRARYGPNWGIGELAERIIR